MNRAFEFWDSQTETNALSHRSWTADPEIQRYIASSIDEESPKWPLQWLRSIVRTPLRRGLSIGCGDGKLERALLKEGICEQVDAFDGGVFSLRIAVRRAHSDGLTGRVRYFAADFNHPVLPGETYDIVFLNQSLHHVQELERLLSAVLRTLKPGGHLFVDEYVGPSRTQWTDELLGPRRTAFEELPDSLRLVPRLDFPIEVADPSEAVRSGEIRELLGVGFDVLSERPYGGNLLSVLYPVIRWDAAPADLLPQLIAKERIMLRAGEPSFYSLSVHVPRRGIGRHLASATYGLRTIGSRVAYAFVLLHRRRLRRLLQRMREALSSRGEISWPITISRWMAALDASSSLRSAPALAADLEAIRATARGAGTQRFGEVYLAERFGFLVTPEEELCVNQALHLLSIELAEEAERLLALLRRHVFRNFAS